MPGCLTFNEGQYFTWSRKNTLTSSDLRQCFPLTLSFQTRLAYDKNFQTVFKMVQRFSLFSSFLTIRWVVKDNKKRFCNLKVNKLNPYRNGSPSSFTTGKLSQTAISFVLNIRLGMLFQQTKLPAFVSYSKEERNFTTQNNT